MTKKVIYFLVYYFILLSTLVYAEAEKFKVAGVITFDKTGPIYVYLATKEEFEADVESKFNSILEVGKQELANNRVNFAFENVPKGTYAIHCFQDVNGNGKPDEGKYGPHEPWGNYRHKRPLFRGPYFNEIKFNVDNNITDITIHLEGKKELPLIGGSLQFGFGAIWESERYKGVGDNMEPIIFVTYEKDRLSILTGDFIDVSYRLFSSNGMSIAGIGSLKFAEGFEGSDSDALKGMDETKMTADIGLALDYALPFADASLSAITEVTGEYDGQKMKLSIKKEWDVKEFKLEPSLNITWQSKKYTDYFYGVSQKEIRSDRPEYTPGSSVNLGAELMLAREIFFKTSLMCMVAYTHLGSEIIDSPIVDQDYVLEVMLFVMYSL